MKAIDLTGRRYGRLVVVSLGEPRRLRTTGRPSRTWDCICDCGGVANRLASALNAKSSCGCAFHLKSTKHGMTDCPEHSVWRTMRQRCSRAENADFKYYGGRGIKVCERWNDFSAFYADMGSRPSDEHEIDRIDVNGDYEPGNCRWVTRIEQMNNRRVRTHCSEGHPYDGDNLYVSPDGHRTCRTCRRIAERARRRSAA